MFTSIQNQLVRFFQEWKAFASVPYNVINVVLSFLLLYLSYEFTRVAALIATKNAAPFPLTDLILSNIPRIDTSFIHGQISFFLFDLRWPLFLLFIRYAPFAAKALASLVFLRALTINLTHLGMPEGIVPTIAEATFGGDLFFSGHVANLFMLALCFWPIRPLRYFFFLMSAVFGISAVLGHYHYTIDVVAAPFFAYGMFVLAKKVFEKDYLMSRNMNREQQTEKIG